MAGLPPSMEKSESRKSGREGGKGGWIELIDSTIYTTHNHSNLDLHMLPLHKNNSSVTTCIFFAKVATFLYSIEPTPPLLLILMTLLIVSQPPQINGTQWTVQRRDFRPDGKANMMTHIFPSPLPSLSLSLSLPSSTFLFLLYTSHKNSNPLWRQFRCLQAPVGGRGEAATSIFFTMMKSW